MDKKYFRCAIQISLMAAILILASCSSTPTPSVVSTATLQKATVTPSPTLLPFTGKIAFSVYNKDMEHYRVYVMNANGSELKDITPLNLLAIQNLAWSPDGQFLAFKADAGQVYQIFKIKSDGSGLAQLTFRDRGAGSPSWSPDGKYIMFGSSSSDILGKLDLSNQDEPVPQIYIMNPDGSDVRRFTVKTKADNTPMIGSYRHDGLISVSERDTRIGAITYIVDSNGVIQKQFPELPSVFPPVWSPDGKFILFSTLRTDCSGIVIMKFDSREEKCLIIDNRTNPPVYAGGASWSPDGNYIIFPTNLENGSGVGNLYAMKLDGSELTRLTYLSTGAGDAAWSAAP